jgi:hypothetical protein
MRTANTLLTILLLLPFDAMAKTITVRGEGFASCAIWIQEHATKSSRQAVQDSWILGYVTAATSMLDVPGVEDVTAAFRNPDLVAWISEYCSSHPDEPIIRAADQLMRELLRRASEQPRPL